MTQTRPAWQERGWGSRTARAEIANRVIGVGLRPAEPRLGEVRVRV